ncbi:hypothetical protein ON010_g16079 [Phytophthora cinnamomi]|nr:hypothetical protein ON010_g16079 [Phytophthora cinnamomi]
MPSSQSICVDACAFHLSVLSTSQHEWGRQKDQGEGLRSVLVETAPQSKVTGANRCVNTALVQTKITPLQQRQKWIPIKNPQRTALTNYYITCMPNLDFEPSTSELLIPIQTFPKMPNRGQISDWRNGYCMVSGATNSQLRVSRCFTFYQIMRGSVVAVLPSHLANHDAELDLGVDKDDVVIKPLLQSKPRFSRPAKTAMAFFGFVALGIASLTTEMQFIPRWASFDPRCSPSMLDAANVNYRSDHRFYAMIQASTSLIPPTFRGKHEALCTDDHADERKFEYCLPITSQDDPVFCAGADRIDLLIRQSPLTLCRASVMHLLVSDAFEELQVAGAAPRVDFSMPDEMSSDSSAAAVPTGFSSISYSGNISQVGVLEPALRAKGYHLFQDNGDWNVCVAPTHPLASHLYDPDCKIGSPVPQVTLVVASTEEITATAPDTEKPTTSVDDSCSADQVDVKSVEYDPNDRFYTILQEMETLPAPAFNGSHKALCSDIGRQNRGYRYCLPITGRIAILLSRLERS